MERLHRLNRRQVITSLVSATAFAATAFGIQRALNTPEPPTRVEGIAQTIDSIRKQVPDGAEPDPEILDVDGAKQLFLHVRMDHGMMGLLQALAKDDVEATYALAKELPTERLRYAYIACSLGYCGLEDVTWLTPAEHRFFMNTMNALGKEHWSAMQQLRAQEEHAQFGPDDWSIQQIIADCNNRFGVSTVHLEGLTPELAERMARITHQLLETRQQLAALPNNRTTARLDLLCKEAKKAHAVHDVAMTLEHMVLDGRIQLAAAQDEEALAAALANIEAVLGTGKKVDDAIIKKLREDATLAMAAASNDPLYLARYGGAHDFRDNIEEWNTAHPNQKFSYVRMTPIGYSAA